MERPEPNIDIFKALFKAVTGAEPNKQEINSYLNPCLSEADKDVLTTPSTSTQLCGKD